MWSSSSWADRLHNMRTLEHLKPEKQQKIARETLDIYAPLAHRLGMGKLRGELEDLAFRYTDSFSYEQLAGEVEALRGEGEKFLDGIVAEIEAKLKEFKIKGRVESRIKRLYSIQQKLQDQKIPVDQVYDLLAVRVICETVQDCYALLGLLHSIWRPVPGRIKDFIAMPRPNLYQSLHTTLIAPGGHQFEVQIRTEDMHRVAEEGIAAALEVQGIGLGQREGRAAPRMGTAVDGVAARHDRSERVHVDAEDRPLPGRGSTPSPPRARWSCCRRTRVPSTSPMPSILRWATPPSVRR